MAPEVWENASSKSGQGFTTKSDIYSMAIVLWEMMWRCSTGSWRLPFPDLHPYVIINEVVENGKRPETNSSMPPLLVSLLQSCWDPSPDKRPACSKVLEELKLIEAEYKENKEEWARNNSVQNPKL
jgi:serine/threonine protein kinase